MTTFEMSTSFRFVIEFMKTIKLLKMGTAVHGGQRHSFREDLEEGKSRIGYGGIEREVSNP